MRRLASLPTHPMHRPWVRPMRWSIAAACFLAAITASHEVKAQQQNDSKLDIASLADAIVSNHAYGGWGPDHPKTKGTKSILNSHAKYHEAIVAEHRERLADLESNSDKTLQMIFEAESADDPASIPLSVETVELLLRECLLELQRIEWEAAALPAMEPSKRAESESRIQMIQLRKAEQAIESIRQKFDIARKAFVNSEVQFKQGAVSEAEHNEQRLRLTAIESELSQKELDLQSALEQLKISQSSELEQTAERSTSLERRRDVVRKQIEQLKSARIRARKTEMLLKQLDRQRAASDSIQQEIARQQLVITEVRTLLKMVDDTKESQKEPQPETKP